MKEEYEKIKGQVADVVLYRSTAYAGQLGSQGFYEVGGRSVDERRHEARTVVYGNPLDIIASQLEEKKFFGWYSSEVNLTGNAGARLIENGTQVSNLEAILHVENGKPKVDVKTIESREYLDELRTPEGFKEYVTRRALEKYVKHGGETLKEISQLY